MIKYNIEKAQNIFDNDIIITWKNTVTGRKDDSGIFLAENMDQAINKLKYIIKQQTAVAINSIAKERRHSYTYSWPATTAKDQEIKYEYMKRIDKLDAFARDCFKLSFDNLIYNLSELACSTLQKIIPRQTSKKHDSIKNKIDQIIVFAETICLQLTNLLAVKQ